MSERPVARPSVREVGAQAVLPAAVCWDMDGTLVDTEPYWIAEEIALVEAHGGVWTHEQALQCVGKTLVTSAELMRQAAGIPTPAQEIADLLTVRVVERVRHDGAPWRDGARELVSQLRRAGVPMALVTMSYDLLAEAVLEALEAEFGDEVMRVVVTGDAVTRGKPHPEPYLTAAERLGVAASDCVALEDSPTGVTSALAAGMRTIAVPLLIDIEARPGLSRVRDLTGISLADLGRVAAGEVIERL